MLGHVERQTSPVLYATAGTDADLPAAAAGPGLKQQRMAGSTAGGVVAAAAAGTGSADRGGQKGSMRHSAAQLIRRGRQRRMQLSDATIGVGLAGGRPVFTLPCVYISSA